jgi:hypothetical protein
MMFPRLFVIALCISSVAAVPNMCNSESDFLPTAKPWPQQDNTYTCDDLDTALTVRYQTTPCGTSTTAACTTWSTITEAEAVASTFSQADGSAASVHGYLLAYGKACCGSTERVRFGANMCKMASDLQQEVSIQDTTTSTTVPCATISAKILDDAYV